MQLKSHENRIRILLIEDDLIDQRAFERFISSEKPPYDYRVANSIDKARQILSTERFDLVIADYQLPDGVSKEILSLKIDTPIIITTGTGSEEIAVEALKEGACDYLIKDPDRYYLKVLPATIERVMSRREVEQKLRMLSHAVMSTQDSVFITDLEGKIIFVNKAFCKTYGYEEKEILTQSRSVLWEAGDRTSAQNELSGEFRHKRKDGVIFPALLSSSFLKDEKERKLAMVYISRDMTERKKAEKNLLEKTEALARSTAELEQLELFAFVASHDLQEPLHKILTFNNLLKTQIQSSLDEKSEACLKKIERSVERMRELIESVRDFSRIARDGNAFEMLELEKVIHEAVSDLEANISESGGRVEVVGKFPVLPADRVQLRLLFENLISNALKFCKKDESPRILIRVEELAKDFVKVSVQDNGIGFDEKYQDYIFKPFQRLHNRNEYKGSGLGLAICQKILLRHGGKIAATGKLNEGATFVFTLPLAEAKEMSR